MCRLYRKANKQRKVNLKGAGVAMQNVTTCKMVNFPFIDAQNLLQQAHEFISFLTAKAYKVVAVGSSLTLSVLNGKNFLNSDKGISSFLSISELEIDY